MAEPTDTDCIRNDYDSPWKDIIERFFPDFMRFFFPNIANDIAWDKGYEFLDKELQKITKDAEIGRRFADKLVKVWIKGQNGKIIETWIELAIHVEVQGGQEKAGLFEHRMYMYNYRIRDRYDVEVVSLAILADSNPAYRPNEFRQDRWGCEITFKFPSIKLIDYAENWKQLEQDNNVFSLVVMAHLKSIEISEGDQRKAWKFRLTKALYKRGWERAIILEMFNFIDWIITLPENLNAAYYCDIEQFEKEMDVKYVTTVERIGIKKGEATVLLYQMEQKFGSLTDELRLRINAADSDTLLKWSGNILTAEKIDEVFH